MVESDTGTRRVNTSGINRASYPVPFLLTPERIQVLDILVHLISNSSDSIILCGPEGAGKTRLLEVLQNYEMPGCSFRQFQAHKDLNSGNIQERLDAALGDERFGKGDRTFSKAHAANRIPQEKTVLIIDDAGELAPGLSAAAFHYANARPSVSLILVLSHDQLQLKYQSDPAIEDCHIVELPALTEKQCGEFVQHMAAQTPDSAGMNALSEAAIEEIYRRSHGLPSRIIAEYSVASKKKPEENPIRILVMAVMGLIVIALAVQWLSSRQTLTESKMNVEEPEKSGGVNLDQPFVSLTVPESANRLSDLNPPAGEGKGVPGWDGSREKMGTVEPVQNPAAKPEPVTGGPDRSAPEQPEASQTGAERAETSEGLSRPDQPVNEAGSEAAEEEMNQEAEEHGDTEAEASDWLSSLPGAHYSLQLMVLSKRQSIADVMKKHPSLHKDFRYIRRIIRNKEKFVLLYGAFPTAEMAGKARQKLPPEFGKAMIRKINAIREEFK